MKNIVLSWVYVFSIWHEPNKAELSVCVKSNLIEKLTHKIWFTLLLRYQKIEARFLGSDGWNLLPRWVLKFLILKRILCLFSIYHRQPRKVSIYLNWLFCLVFFRIAKQAMKLYYMHFWCLFIILFNTDLYKSALTSYSSDNLVFRLSVFCIFCLFCFELDFNFADFSLPN